MIVTGKQLDKKKWKHKKVGVLSIRIKSNVSSVDPASDKNIK